jgi:hypothetical protein
MTPAVHSDPKHVDPLQIPLPWLALKVQVGNFCSTLTANPFVRRDVNGKVERLLTRGLHDQIAEPIAFTGYA